MTPQEEQLLNSLAERVNKTQLTEKDPDAEELLRRELGSNPDALYILAQTVLVQNIALEQAKAQMAQLQQARPQPARATSFLGGLLGHRDPEPTQPPYQPVAPQPIYAQPQYQQPQYVPAPSGQPSFLRGAMQTAAGVAAGALAFEGVESVLHGLGGFGRSGVGWGGPGIGWGGQGFPAGGFDRPVEETVVNNYYDEPGGRENLEHGEHRFQESGAQGGDAQFSDARYDNGSDPGNDDQSTFDDNSLDNDDGRDGGSDSDDSGSFDDSSDFGSDSGGDLI